MSTGVIIFVRFDSIRLPGKALLNISGRSLLGHVIDRVKKVKSPAKMVVATSERDVDDPIEKFASKEGIDVFRGDLHDVAVRALNCSNYYSFNRFVRVCVDRPFIDPDLIDLLLWHHIDKNLDLATNALIKTYPRGLMTEVISVSALRRVILETNEPEDREHLTRFIYNRPDLFKIWNIASSNEEWKEYNLSVDTPVDLERTKWVYSQLKNIHNGASIGHVISLAKKWEMHKS